MKAIQVPSFTAGQRIITTLDPTDHRGRAAIAVPCGECDYGKVLVPMGPMVRGMYVRDCTACNGLGSLIVASAVVTDCVPIRTWASQVDPPYGRWLVPHPGSTLKLAWQESDGVILKTHLGPSDQFPYADFAPGRWAWLLDDVQPTTVRCPGCWGSRSGDPDQYTYWYYGVPEPGSLPPCLTCQPGDDGYPLGHCPPIPVKAEPGLWEWTP